MKNNKKILIISILIFSVLLTGLVLYMIFRKDPNSQTAVEPTSDPTIVTDTPDSTSTTLPSEQPTIPTMTTTPNINSTVIDNDKIQNYFIEKSYDENKLLDAINNGKIASNYYQDTVLTDAYFIITIQNNDVIFLSKIESSERGYEGSSGLIQLNHAMNPELADILSRFPENLKYTEGDVDVYIVSSLDSDFKKTEFNYKLKSPSNYDFYGINLWRHYPKAGTVEVSNQYPE